MPGERVATVAGEEDAVNSAIEEILQIILVNSSTYTIIRKIRYGLIMDYSGFTNLVVTAIVNTKFNYAFNKFRYTLGIYDKTCTMPTGYHSSSTVASGKYSTVNCSRRPME